MQLLDGHRMRLKSYFKTTSQSELARALGVTQGLVSHWVTGRVRITAERAIQIEEVTGGAVTRQELRPDLYQVDQDRSVA